MEALSDKVVLVITHCPSAAVAEAIARVALDARLVACANLQAPCRSIYRWQGKLEEANEVPLHLKSTAGAFDALCSLIKQHHPYELPEIIAVDLVQGLPAYLSWVSEQVGVPAANG